MLPVKCVLVGDSTVGNTRLLLAYTGSPVVGEYVPTVFENYTQKASVGGQEVSFTLWDTTGQERYDRIRRLSYPETDIFVLCFSVISEASFKNLPLWNKEVSTGRPDALKILVGTKVELRMEREAQGMVKKDKVPVTKKKGQRMAKRLGCVEYLECSAETGQGVQEVFDAALVAAVKEIKRKEKEEKKGKKRRKGLLL